VDDRDRRIRQLEEELQFQSEQRKLALNALDMTADLVHFDTRLKKTSQPRDILEQAVVKLRQLIGFKALGFYLIQEEDASFEQALCEPKTWSPVLEEERSALVQDRTFAWALNRNRPVLISATSIPATLLLHPIATPSRTRGMFVGVLEQDTRDIYDFSYSLLTMVLLSCANFLESFELYSHFRGLNDQLSRLLEERSRRAQELRSKNEDLEREIAQRRRSEQILQEHNAYFNALHETSLGLMRRLDLDELLETILERAGELLQVEDGFIYLFDPEDRVLKVHAGRGRYRDLVGFQLQPGEGLAGRVFAQGKPVVVDNYQQWEGRSRAAVFDELCSAVSVPLKSGHETIGAIGLNYSAQSGFFGQEAVVFLNRFAQLASIALDNAYLHRALQQELSERRRAEEALSSREAELKTILESNPAGTVMVNAQTRRIIWANQHALKMIKARKDQVVGQVCHEFLCPAEQGACPVLDLGRKVDTAERTLRTLQGKTVPVLKSAVPMEYKGQPCLLETFFDLTRHKELEAQLRQASKMEAVGTLAGGVAHDFNNLLQGLVGNVQYLLRHPGQGDRQTEVLLEMDRILSRASGIVNRLLTFGRKTEFSFNALDLNTLVLSTQAFLRRAIPQMVEIHLDLDQDLPLITADPTQIEQVLINLVSNAADAIQPHGRGTVTIRTRILRLEEQRVTLEQDLEPGEYLLLAVEDDGCGMDPDVLQSIFDPFYTTKDVDKGTGLGLATVSSIVKEHGGGITCSSTPGEGTSFQLFFPVPAHEVRDQFLEESLGAEPADLTGSESVLVIDDEEMIRDITQDLLEDHGYTVYTAESGEKGLELYERHRDKLDVILLDLGMPGMGGRAFLEQVRGLDPEVNVIVSTGYAAHEMAQEPRKYGASAFVPKPYRPDEMLQVIRSILDQG
jgi:PAS domain S-box-containing protein